MSVSHYVRNKLNYVREIMFLLGAEYRLVFYTIIPESFSSVSDEPGQATAREQFGVNFGEKRSAIDRNKAVKSH